MRFSLIHIDTYAALDATKTVDGVKYCDQIVISMDWKAVKLKTHYS